MLDIYAKCYIDLCDMVAATTVRWMPSEPTKAKSDKNQRSRTRTTMTAEEKIRFAIAEYCHRTDSGDFDGWVKLFAEDGTFRMFGNEVVGHAPLRAFIAQDQSPELRGLHLTTVSAITLQGDRAKVR